MSNLSNKVRVGTVGITVAAMSLALPASAAVSATSTRTSETRLHEVGIGTENPSRQENIGVFTGLAVGAATGGPVGAVVGMVAGGLLGHHYHEQSLANHELSAQNHALAARNHTLTASLSRSEEERQGLAGKLDLAAQSLAATQEQRAELDRTVQLSDDIETDVAFRTADASINGLQLPALQKIGALAASLPAGAKVQIDGYADPRGPATLNDDLSLRRAEAVALALQQAGVPEERLVIAAHGASQSTSPRGDLDAYAFDRRVTVRLEGTAVVQSSDGQAGAQPALAARR
jgi:outer membrane protein OmpA-like peptidoglycan-associated protein